MGEAKHTPPPWEWSSGQNGRLCFDDRAHFSSRTVLLITEPRWMPSPADARMLAAAPEMYEALTELHRECIAAAERAGTTWPLNGAAKALDDKVRAAIAKAEGRADG